MFVVSIQFQLNFKFQIKFKKIEIIIYNSVLLEYITLIEIHIQMYFKCLSFTIIVNIEKYNFVS